jgi:MSHA biogenesis protein MshP
MTKHPRLQLPSMRRSAGVGLVTAIFLLVVLGGLALAIVSLTSAQHVASYLDVQGTLAQQAARAGGEVATFRVLVNGGNCPASDNIAMLPGTSLSSYTVTVTCTRVAGPTAELERFIIKSTACNQPGGSGCPNQNASADYVQRVVEVRL